MGFIRSIPAPARARSWLAAPLVAAMLVLAIVGPVAAARGPVRLADPSVSPVQVQFGESITFSVVYSNGQGNAPTSIVVKVGSVEYPMSALASSTNYGAGVTYTAVAAPPAGTWTVEFIATDKFGNVATLAGSDATVLAPPPPPTPAPTPTPTPAPTPKPTPTPTQAPAPTATPAPAAFSGGSGSSSGGSGTSGSGSSGSGGTSGPGSAGSSGSSVGSGATAAGTSGGPAAVASGAWSQHDDIRPPWQTGLATTSSSSVAGPSSGFDPAAGSLRSAAGAVLAPAGRDAWAHEAYVSSSPVGGIVAIHPAWPFDASLAALPGVGGSLPIGGILTTSVVTLGGVAMTMAFMLFGRRRQDDDPTDSDEALASAAATGAGMVAAGALVGGLGGRSGPAAGLPPINDAELDLPRWRRPSLLAARKEDPLRTVHTDAKLTFDRGAVAPIDGVERRAIRYRLVRLLDSPDELVATEVGFLDEGDEVQLLERSGAYWLVLCPDGRQGWVHRMVLGDVIEDGASGEDSGNPVRAPFPGERTGDSLLGPAAGIRLASQGSTAWSLQGAGATDAGMDVDDDVLRAYLASRGIA